MKLGSLPLSSPMLVYLSGCSGGGNTVGSAPATVNGLASSGKALASVTVIITDSGGTECADRGDRR